MVFRCRYFIILVFVLWTVFAVDRSLGLGPLTQREEYLPLDHPLILTRDTIENDFVAGSGTNSIRVSIYFGIKDINKEKVSMWDPEDLGEIIYDDDFDMSSEEA
jgi:predicted RND superfamily exporter protein